MHIFILIIICITILFFAHIMTNKNPLITWDDLEESFGFVFRGDEIGIICLDCGHVSYHDKDVEERYCGYCDKFHEDNNENIFKEELIDNENS